MTATTIAPPLFFRPLDGDAALLPRTPNVAEAYHALVLANRDRLAAWERYGARETTLEWARDFLAGSAASWVAGTQLGALVAVREQRAWTLVGSVGLPVDRANRSGELGYWIDGAYEGRGLMTAAATVLLDEAFGPAGLDRVEIRADVDNTRSRAVARRLGFREEGVLRQAVALDGRRSDDVVHGLLAAEWRARRSGTGTV